MIFFFSLLQHKVAGWVTNLQIKLQALLKQTLRQLPVFTHTLCLTEQPAGQDHDVWDLILLYPSWHPVWCYLSLQQYWTVTVKYNTNRSIIRTIMYHQGFRSLMRHDRLTTFVKRNAKFWHSEILPLPSLTFSPTLTMWMKHFPTRPVRDVFKCSKTGNC